MKDVVSLLGICLLKNIYGKLLIDKNKRDAFFADYDRLIAIARDGGHYEAMIAHATCKKELIEHFAMFD